MKHLYLLWQLPIRWDVYNDLTCPPLEETPEYTYKKYEDVDFYHDNILKNLSETKRRLNKGKVIPTKNNHADIFPSLEILLEERLPVTQRFRSSRNVLRFYALVRRLKRLVS